MVTVSDLANLTLQEITQLKQCEIRIELGINVFMEVGDALLSIRDNRLYRATHSTFEEYCQERWGIERRRAYQLISAAQVIRNVQDDMSVNRGSHSVISERQVRPLTGLDPTTQRDIWAQVLKENPEGGITGPKVQEVVNRMMGVVDLDDDDDDVPVSEEFREFEREVLLPRLHDAGLEDAPQILSGLREGFQPASEQEQEQAASSIRQSVIEQLILCRQGHSVEECADELLEILGQSSSSIALAARFGIALAGNPQTLADLTAMAIDVCGESIHGMEREDYLRRRKRVLRLIDSLTYSGCGIFEHKMQNGQLCYALTREI